LRQQRLEDTAERERQRANDHFDRALAWLDVRLYEQEDLLSALADKSFSNTSDWFMSHRVIAKWISSVQAPVNVWVHGKPGSGKALVTRL
jgi:hypothetical protein